MKHYQKNNGFTLIELLVVVLIIGILSAIALPQYRVAVARAKVGRALPLLRSIVQAKERYYLANGQYTNILENLDVQFPYEKAVDTDSGSRQYQKTPIGNIALAPTSSGVFWEGPNVVIDTYSGRQICYAFDNTGPGNRICASFGTKTGKTSNNGTAMYNVSF